jgi:ketosteroid isomerase-like protein
MAQDLEMSASDRLIELEAIRDLKARRDHAVDRKDWDAYAAMHTHDYVALAIRPGEEIVGGRAAADAIAAQMAGVTSVHHSHTPVIEFQDRNHATGVWAMEDNLFWKRDGEKQWIRGFGFYHERYVKGPDGNWRFSYRRLDRLHVETSPGATAFAHDATGENPRMGRAG